MEDGSVLPVLVQNRTGYQNLCRLITRAKLRGTKEHAPVRWDELAEFAEGLVALTGDEEGPVARGRSPARRSRRRAQAVSSGSRAAFGEENVFVEIQRHLRRGEELRQRRAASISPHAERLPLLATNGVLYAQRRSSARCSMSSPACGITRISMPPAGCSAPMPSAISKPPRADGAALSPICRRRSTTPCGSRSGCNFSLENLGYEFPRLRGAGRAKRWTRFLRKRDDGRRARALLGISSRKCMTQLETRTRRSSTKLGFCGYFLIVWDIVQFLPRARTSWCRAAAARRTARSVIRLGITACDPIAVQAALRAFPQRRPQRPGRTSISICRAATGASA